ncbi:MAG: EamA family transporter, partial [Paracoccaceae bacterium]
MTITARTPALTGILCAIAGSAVFSINDVAVKSLSGGYALHQVMLIRAFIGLAFLITLMALTRAEFRQLITRRPGTQFTRVVFVMVSNVTFFLGLSVLPLADAVAIAFV